MGVRLVSNPPNPYETAYREWLGEPPPARLEVYEEQARSIVTKNESPDIPFDYSINPYRGCQHACAYCYARTTHEYLGYGAGTDFDSKIFVKVNAADLLEGTISRPRWRGDAITFSGVTDCYQPLEAVYKVTRACLDVCVRYRNPVGIITKSFLITRDIDLLAELARVASVHVCTSIAFIEDTVARRIEPGAPPPSRRFEAVRLLSQAGIPVSVMVAPLIPGLNDREVPALLERAAECGATSASFGMLRLAGNVAPVFLARLREQLPRRAARVEQLIRDARCGALNNSQFFERFKGHGAYWQSVTTLFNQTAARLGLDRSPRETRNGPAVANTPGRRPLPIAGQLRLFES